MSVFSSPSFDKHELVAYSEDHNSGLRAIIAVHNTTLGPAVGGCRFYPYAREADALEDVLRLSKGMTYKSALAGLPMGGGKAVIIGNPATDKQDSLLHAMGRFIDSLSGKYVTAEDSGTSVADMYKMAEVTPHVSGIGSMDRFGGDPSPYTAYGIFCGIQAAVRQRLGRDDLAGLRVAVQGAGAVGRFLIERLLKAGAKVQVADINPQNLQKAQALGAELIDPQAVLTADVDVLAPCAMGAIITKQNVEQIQAAVIAGGANNQLATDDLAEDLNSRDILYAPDYAINAGGIIAIEHQRNGSTEDAATEQVAAIGETLRRIFETSADTQQTTLAVANQLAEEKFRVQPH